MPALLDQHGKEIVRAKGSLSATPRGHVKAKYDSAQTNSSNQDYWANADSLSARMANSPGVRKILRERSRYEVANNCYAKGMLRTDSDYVIGIGPRVQLNTSAKAYNREVTAKFHKWARVVRFGRKLWTLRFAWNQDGEGLGQFATNPALRSPVKLDLHLIECDQVADDGWHSVQMRNDDGIILDDFGNVSAYKVWAGHPGGVSLFSDTKPELVPARDIIHLFRRTRPGQYRGVPEITPALMLYPTMRRLTYATLGNAEKNARVAGVIKSTFDVENPNLIDPMEEIQLEADSFLTLPEGWDISQLKSEQPSANYDMFKREVISEIARCLNQPFNIAAADSSKYNFASGKLDRLGWYKSVRIDQAQFDDDACTPTFERWFEEASRIDGYLPSPPDEFDPRFEAPPHSWFWDGESTIDPREAGSRDTSLKNGSLLLTDLYSSKGSDIEEAMRAEAEFRRMTVDELIEAYNKNHFSSTPAIPEDQEQPEDEDEGE